MDPTLIGICVGAAAALALVGTGYFVGRSTLADDLRCSRDREATERARADAAEEKTRSVVAAAVAKAGAETISVGRDRAIRDAGDDLERVLHAAGRKDPPAPPGDHVPETDGE